MALFDERRTNLKYFFSFFFVDEVWLKFDDDKVTPVGTDEVLKLSGGGDWHCAYLLLYGPRPVPVRVKKADPPSRAALTMGKEVEDMPMD